ncbi:helix-turn-helix domain-containing protein [Paracoccus methylarcula]|uniref:helix-turn-helix domain-containing protein n=1 Tax=Paracoccus methylarcula TaxID=72022 RepID=UPI001FE59F41|nr:helix-turn-helix domain-containing protein [Paracoccus methylarcula]
MSRINDDIEAEGDRNFVTAIARGFEVLRCFRLDETTLTNQEIAGRTGLPKPTVSRLTYTLCKLGYLVQSDAKGPTGSAPVCSRSGSAHWPGWRSARWPSRRCASFARVPTPM